MEQSRFQICWRVRLGVTGHRTLRAPSAVRSRVAEVLSTRIPEFVRSCAAMSPGTPIRYLLVTSLAEGADRLVAREMLALEDAAMEAVLPVSEGEYTDDFDTPESVREFEELLGQAVRRVHMHAGPASGEVEPPAVTRQNAYAEAGRYVVDHCDMLLAVWDGEPPRGPGGTAEVIEYARERGRPVVIVGANGQHEVSLEQRAGMDCLSAAGIHQFNSRHRAEAERAYVENLQSVLFENKAGQAVPEAARTLIRDVILPAYARASLPAKRYGGLYEKAGLWAQVLSVAAIASVGVGILWPALSPEAFGLELVLLLAVLGIVSAAHRGRSHRNWIDNRLLAERLRAAIFVRACGLAPAWMDPPLDGTAPGWVFRVFAEVWLRIRPGISEHRDWRALREFVRTQWLDEQIRFHETKANGSRRILFLLEKIGQALFATAVAAAALHVLLFDAIPALVGTIIAGHAVWQGVSWLAVVLPAAGAALVGIRSQREYSRLEQKSRMMVAALRDVQRRLERAATGAEFDAALRAAETSMLAESEDWLMLMQHVVLEAT